MIAGWPDAIALLKTWAMVAGGCSRRLGELRLLRERTPRAYPKRGHHRWRTRRTDGVVHTLRVVVAIGLGAIVVARITPGVHICSTG
jgi:hypothetical protein